MNPFFTDSEPSFNLPNISAIGLRPQTPRESLNDSPASYKSGQQPIPAISGACVNGPLEFIEKQTHIKMKAYLTITTMAAALAVATLTPQRASAADPMTPAVAQPDIVAAAASKSELSTLVTAIKAAELVTVLQGQGPFTVFAPTDAAFKKLPAGQLEDLLKPENRMKLATILKGHFIKGRVKASDVKAGEVKTLDGEEVEIAVQNGKVSYGNAAVVATDISTSNGVIHEIDTVVIED